MPFSATVNLNVIRIFLLYKEESIKNIIYLSMAFF